MRRDGQSSEKGQSSQAGLHFPLLTALFAGPQQTIASHALLLSPRTPQGAAPLSSHTTQEDVLLGTGGTQRGPLSRHFLNPLFQLVDLPQQPTPFLETSPPPPIVQFNSVLNQQLHCNQTSGINEPSTAFGISGLSGANRFKPQSGRVSPNSFSR